MNSVTQHRLSGKKLHFAKDTLKYMQEYSWPGNVRELENTVFSLLSMIDDGTVRPHHLPAKIVPEQPSIEECREGLGLKGVEKRLIEAALDESKGNVSEAAIRLNMSRSTIYRKVKKYCISFDLVRSATP
jgi:transcriptional regulator of acetoin/glycerol metabolism